MAAFVVVDGVTVTTSYFADSECKTKATDLTACEAAVKSAKEGSASITDDCTSSASFSASGAGSCKDAGDVFDKCTAAGLGGSFMKMSCSANAVFSSALVVAVAVFANSLF